MKRPCTNLSLIRFAKTGNFEEAKALLFPITSSKLSLFLDSAPPSHVPFLDQIHLQNKLDSNALHKLMYFYCKSNSNVANLFDWIKSKNLVSRYTIHIYIQSLPYANAHEILTKMDMLGICPNLQTFMFLLSKVPSLQSVDPLLNAMLAHGIRINSDFCSLLIKFHAQRHQLIEMNHYQNLAKCSNFSINNKTRLAVAQAYGEMHKFDQMEQVLHSTNDKEKHLIALKVYAKLGKFDQIDKWVFKMHTDEIPMNIAAFSILIAANARHDRLDALGPLLMDMKSKNIQPNDFIYSSLIAAYGKSRKFEELESVINEMNSAKVPKTVGIVDPNATQDIQMRDLKPDLKTYTSLITAHGKNGQFDKMEDVLSKMYQRGLEPDVYTFTALINAYGRVSRFSDIEMVVGRMKERQIVPNLATFTSLISSYGRTVGNIDQMEATWADMQKSNITPDVKCYTALIHGYHNNGMTEKRNFHVQKVQLIANDASELLYILVLYSDTLTQVEALLEKQFNLVIMHNHLISIMNNLDSVKLQDFLNLLIKYKVPLSKEMYRQSFLSLKAKSDFENVTKLYQKAKSDKVVLSLDTFNILVDFYRTTSLEHLEIVIKDLQESGLL
jgi:pentatricopeptide repeat protein